VFKINIAIDLDGTLFPTYETIESVFLRMFGPNIDWKALKTSDEYRNSEKGKWIIRTLNRERLYNALVMSSEAKYFLEELKERGDHFIYWTARPTHLRNVTLYSLGKNEVPLGPVYFVPRSNAASRKLLVAKAEKIDIAIEDNPDVASELNKICKVILINHDYNQKCDCNRRVNSWSEINKIFTI